MLTSPTKYHILVLGGTGLCGLIFCHTALEAGHALTLYCRNPSKIPADLSSNPKLTIIQGELNDEEGLKKAAACGAEIFISFAGPTLMKREGTVRASKGNLCGTRLINRIASNPRSPKTLPSHPRKRHNQTSLRSLNRLLFHPRRWAKLEMVPGNKFLHQSHWGGCI